MFVGHYKCVSSPEEFYSTRRNSLDFPSQVEVNKKRYMLARTYHIASDSKYDQFVEAAERNSIPHGIEIN